MNLSKQLLQVINFSILPITILSVIWHPNAQRDFISNFTNTTFWWIIQSFILIAFWQSKKYYFDFTDSKNIEVVKWYLWWNIFSSLRGLFIAENYWDWKGLVGYTMALLLPIVAYAASNKKIVQSILSFYIRFTLPLFIIFSFLIATDAYGDYLVPISFLLLFLPAITLRWKVAILLISLLVITIDLGARSNVIKFALPIILSIIYYFRIFISTIHLEIIRKILFIAPILLFVLAVTNVFNVFKINEYIKGEYETTLIDSNGEAVEENLTVDTRTFLYVEVLQTAKKYNTWWIGRSPARGNETEYFSEDDLTGRGERGGNEVAILNIFTWTGIVGVFLYFLIFYKASYLAINQSNNFFAKIVGLFIAFRWLYAWVEDINYFTLTTFMLWITLGICFSKSFREMSNQEVKYWIWGFFEKKYRLNMK